MMKHRLLEVAERLMSVPAAPYHESCVRRAAEQICVEHNLKFRRDRFGNVWVHHRKRAAGRRPLVLAAHLDHPGFEIKKSIGDGRYHARFNGGVGDPYFKRGIPVRLMPGSVAAVLERRLGPNREFELRERRATATQTRHRPDEPLFAVWELPDFERKGNRIIGRACDDLIGVATILCVLIELNRAAVDVVGLLSRAEEVGFHGALAAAANNEVPKNPLIISLETSRELPGVKMGEGVIIRVGDRSSIFDSAATRFLMETAGVAKRKIPAFKSQRALMSGGTCEATAFQEFGYQTAAVCVALGNYHNCGGKNRIEAEYVDVNDAVSMGQLLVETARQMKNFERLTGKLPARLRKLAREATRKLSNSLAE